MPAKKYLEEILEIFFEPTGQLYAFIISFWCFLTSIFFLVDPAILNFLETLNYFVLVLFLVFEVSKMPAKKLFFVNAKKNLKK